MYTMREGLHMSNYKKIEKVVRVRKTAGKAVVYTLLTVWAIVVLFPFYWMLLTSLKSYSSYNSEHIPVLFTLSLTLENYKTAFTAVPLARYFTNTIIFTVATTAIMLVVTVLAAFAFSRLDFRGKNAATVGKYIRDASAFCKYLKGGRLTKETAIAYKQKPAKDGYTVRSINS